MHNRIKEKQAYDCKKRSNQKINNIIRSSFFHIITTDFPQRIYG